MFRFETLSLTALLAAPVVALWLRGDFTDYELAVRVGYCFLAAWGAVALVRYAAKPLPQPAPHHVEDPTPSPHAEQGPTDV